MDVEYNWNTSHQVTFDRLKLLVCDNEVVQYEEISNNAS